MNRIGWIEVLVQDLRYAVRSLRRSPAFTIAAVLTLAVGIGGTTAIFSVVNATLLRPLPFSHPEQLISVTTEAPEDGVTGTGASSVELRALDNPKFSVVGAAGLFARPGVGDMARADGTSLSVIGSPVDEGFFGVLGVHMMLGRSFTHKDFRLNRGTSPGPKSIIISYDLWTKLGRDPTIVGKPLPISGTARFVVGVTPPDMDIPRGTDFWFPGTIALYRAPDVAHVLQGILRVRPGTSLQQLRSAGRVVMADIARHRPDDTEGDRRFVMKPLLTSIVGGLSTTILIVFGATALLLLLASVNVSNLLLARAVSRTRELAVRAALGASRSRLALHVLTEALLLACAGATGGVALAYAIVHVLPAFGTANLPRLSAVPFDGRVLLFALALLAFTTLVIGVLPAWRSASVDTRGSLNEGTQSATPARGAVRSMSTLIVAEVAVALVLTAGAGWLIQSFAKLSAVNPGFTAAGRLIVSTSQPLVPPTESWTRFRTMLQGIRAIPGVAHAGASMSFPMLMDREGATLVSISGRAPSDATRASSAYLRMVTPGFFAAMGTRTLAGRDFDDDDRRATRSVAIVNQAFVRKFLTGLDPLRARLSFGYPSISAGSYIIVGTVNDVRYKALDSAPEPTVYVDEDQLFLPSLSPVFVIAARAGNPLALIPRIRSTMRALAPRGAVEFQTATAAVSNSLGRQRLGMTLMLGFGVIALLLAAIGIYGVIGYVVAQRREEIAMRIALGASGRHVFWFIVGGGQRLTLLGVALGLVGAYAGGLVVASRVYAMRASDPIVLAGAAVVVTVVALGATLIPASRASRLDPGRILRSE